jgi:hypothetical protein
LSLNWTEESTARHCAHEGVRNAPVFCELVGEPPRPSWQNVGEALLDYVLTTRWAFGGQAVTVRLSPSAVTEAAVNGVSAGPFSTEPSEMENSLPWQLHMILPSLMLLTGQPW